MSDDIYYEVDITIGVYHWLVKQTDTTDPVDPGPLGGLEFGWSLPTQDTYPCQPDPMDAALGILVSSPANVEAVDIGSTVGIKVRFDTTGTWPLEFYGKVTDLRGTPHPRGWLLGLLALDHSVDDDHNITAVSWPSESADVRLARIFAANGITTPTSPWTATAAIAQPAVEISSEPWIPLVARSLGNIIGTDGTLDVIRAIIAPVVSVGDLDGYAFDPIGKTNLESLEGAFGATDDGYGIVFTADPATGVLDAAKVERSVNWTRRKYDAVNRLEIVATDDSVIVAATGQTPVVTGRLALDMESATDTSPSMAEFYLPDSGAVSRWSIEALTWRMDKEAQATLETMGQGWMPVHAAAEGDPIRTLAYRRPVVVAGIPDRHNPATSEAYAGQLRSARFSVATGTPLMAFTMRRSLPAPTVDPLTPAGLAGSAYAAVTVAQLDPDFTVYDYRLAQEA